MAFLFGALGAYTGCQLGLKASPIRIVVAASLCVAALSLFFGFGLWMSGRTIYANAQVIATALAATGLCMLIVLPILFLYRRQLGAPLWRFMQITYGLGALSSIGTVILIGGDDFSIIVAPFATLPAVVLTIYATIQHRHARFTEETAH